MIRKLLATAYGCFALLVGTAKAEETVAKIGETGYSSLGEAIKSVQAGETITLVSDVEINTAISGENCTSAQDYTLDLNGKTISASAELGLSAYNADWEDVYEATGKINLYKPTRVAVKNGSFRAVGDSGRIRVEDGGSATIENVTFTVGDILYGGSSSLADCKKGVRIFQGWQNSDGEQNAYVFNNCNFTDCYVGIEGSSNCAASGTEFIGCTFTLTGEKYIENVVSINFSINGSVDFSVCAFDITNFAKNSSTTRTAVAIDSDARTEAGLSISLKDTTFTGTTNPKGGSVSFIDVRDKSTTIALTGTTSVTVDGTAVESPVPNAVASVNGTYYADLAAALKAAVAAKNATVEIVDDITFADGDTWMPVAIGKNTTLVVNGNGKTIMDLPGCLFGTTHESEMQTGSSLTMKSLKFVNPTVRVNKPKIYGDNKDYSFAAVVLAEAYGMDVTLVGVEIEGADVRGGDDCYTAGFVGWCNDASSVPDAKHPVVKLQNCALRNSKIIGRGTAAGLVGHVAANEIESVILIVTDCEVINNTIVCTEEGKNNKAGAVVATVAGEGAKVSAKVSGNTVYSGKGSIDDTDDTNWKTGTEITTIYGRRSGSGTLSLTGGTYDREPIAAADAAWAQVAKGFELKQGADNTYAVSEVKYVAQVGDTKYASLAKALNEAIAANDGVGFTKVEIIDDIVFTDSDDWNPVVFTQKKRIEVVGVGENRKIVDLPKSLFTAAGTANSGQMLRMRDLKFENPKAENPRDYASAVILGYCDVAFELTFENVWIDNATVSAKKHAGAFLGFVALYAPEHNVKFTNCKVTNSRITSDEGSVGALAGHANGGNVGTVTVVDCEISGNVISYTTPDEDGLKGGAVFGSIGNAPVSVSANVSGNTVTSAGTSVTTIYGRQGSAGGRLTVTGGTYDHAPIDAEATWAGVSANCTQTATEVDGKTVYTVAKTAVAKVNGVEYSSLAEAIEEALSLNDGTPVEIQRDITFAPGDTWTPIAYDKGSPHRLVVNGSGYKIVNLPNAMFARTERGYYLRMSNLTFENPVVKSDSDAAVIVGWAESVDELTFTDVAIRGAKVTGGNYAAGFVGYCALDNSGKKAVTYTRCEVSGSTITGGSSAGAVMGHANGAVNGSVHVVDTVIENNVIVCTEAGKTQPGTTKAGAVFGTVGASDTFVSAAVSDNTVISGGVSIEAGGVAVSTIYGRLGSEGGTLSLTGGTYDKRPFNAGDDWAKVDEWCKLVEQDGLFTVVDNLATLGNVKARQRYPWNGLVDITFELKSKNAACVFIVAEYADGGVTKRLPMTTAKLVNDDKSESQVDVSTGFTVPAQATAKTIHVIWDSTTAVPTRLSGVTFRVYAK